MPDLSAETENPLALLQTPYVPITTLKQLHHFLQNAVTLEFATIPAYTTAMYSMQDRTCPAYQLTRSVAYEEMFHVYQAANLLIAVGAGPRFTGAFTPKYPTYVPNGDPTATPFIGLQRASTALYQKVFMGIETPAPFDSPPQDVQIRTIGQFYKAIQDGIEFLEAEAQKQGGTIFHDAPGYAQHKGFYLGNGGGRIIPVTDLDSARLAIQQIVQQGEGAVTPGHPLTPKEPWGAYNHYGVRTDGEYGPILGRPVELSHYFKFKRVADGVDPLPAVQPIVANPDESSYANPKAKTLSLFFNAYYSVTLRALEQSFKASETDENLFYQIALPIMREQLPTLATQLMATPIWTQGDSDVGPNACPAWRYITPGAGEADCASLASVNEKVQTFCDELAGEILADPGRAGGESLQALHDALLGVAGRGRDIEARALSLGATL